MEVSNKIINGDSLKELKKKTNVNKWEKIINFMEIL